MAKSKSATQSKYLQEYLGINKESVAAANPPPLAEVAPQYPTLSDMPIGYEFSSGSQLKYLVKDKIFRQVPYGCQWVIIKEVQTGAEKHQFPNTAPGSINFRIVYIEVGGWKEKRQVATLS